MQLLLRFLLLLQSAAQLVHLRLALQDDLVLLSVGELKLAREILALLFKGLEFPLRSLFRFRLLLQLFLCLLLQLSVLLLHLLQLALKLI